MKKLNFSRFVHSLCLVLVLIVSGISGKECGDPECKTVIAKGYVTLRYMGGGGNKVNLNPNEKLDILAVNIGKNNDLWVRKTNGKEGLASPKFVRETEIVGKIKDRIKIPDSEESTQEQRKTTNPDQIVPAKTVNQEVIDGTTITTSPEPPAQVAEEIPPANPIDEGAKTPELVDDPLAIISSEQDLDNSLPQPHITSDDPSTAKNSESVDQSNAGSGSSTTAEQIASTDATVVPNKEDEGEGTNKQAVVDSLPQQPATSSEDPSVVSGSDQSGSIEQNTLDVGSDEKKIKTEDAQSSAENVTSAEEEDEEAEHDSEDGDEGEEEDAEDDETDKEVVEDSPSESGENSEGRIVESTVADSSSKLLIDEAVIQDPITTNVPEQTVPQAQNSDPGTEETVEQSTKSAGEVTTGSTVQVSTTDSTENVEIEHTSGTNVENILATGEETVVDQRVEIPVTEEHENTIYQQPPVDEVIKPIISGGLSGLLSHHHHHHHHGHGHHNHHHHDHGHGHHHHHDHAHDDHQHQQLSGEVSNQEPVNVQQHTHDSPLLSTGGQGSIEEVSYSKSVDHSTNDPHKHDHFKDLPGENEYCDQQACPQPNPGHDPTRQQASNGGGFHHPMVSGQQAFDSMANYPDPNHEYEQSSSSSPLVESDDQDYTKMIITELIQLSDLILLLGITSFTLIVFSLGHYLISKNRKEKPLIYKLNMVERDLMASHKENSMLKADLAETKHKLTSIENNSFGSNDMVIALRQELEDAEQTKLELQEQIGSLEKELENAAEAGLELNKMVAELLNQSGSDSIAMTVDELQKQLNEQQQTILSMNNTLAEKSRENSELQVTLANQSGKFKEEQEELQQTLNDLKLEKSNMEIELNNLRSGQNTQLEVLQKETSIEIGKLNKEVKSFQSKWEESKKSLLTAEAKIEALEECIQDIKKGNNGGNVDGLIDSAEMKAKIAVLTKEKANLEDRLKGEIVARQLLDDHVKIINEDISTLKKEFGQAEKDKLEAETRLEVLSTYFKEKETQLQKELSIKEAMWMQQQGETTSTVERIRQMQDEIQQLKSQNDKLRVEIDAQTVAHKAQYTALETRSHEAWLAARQAGRRLEESRVESSNLRRKLTALGDISVNNTTTDGMMANVVPPPAELGLTAPSPIRVESPNAPMMALPPPPFIPPPFGPPFMPPFMPPPNPGEMRPAPLGRLMSPPPNRYSPSMMENRGNDRYSPDRGRYSPDSRYDYSVMSNYETETDFSPPPSPPPHSRRSNYDRDPRDRDHHHREHDLRDRERDLRDRDGRTSGNGGDRSAGSGGGYPKAFSPPSMRTTSPPIQDPRNKKYQGGFSSGSQDSVATRRSGKKQQFRNGKPT